MDFKRLITDMKELNSIQQLVAFPTPEVIPKSSLYIRMRIPSINRHPIYLSISSTSIKINTPTPTPHQLRPRPLPPHPMDLPPPQIHNLHISSGDMHTPTPPTTRVDGPLPRPRVLEIQTRAPHGGDVSFETIKFRPRCAFGVIHHDALAAGFAGCGEVALVTMGGGRVDVQAARAAAGADAGAEAVDDAGVAAAADGGEDDGVF